MIPVGVATGLGAAVMQSASYFFSRLYVIRRAKAVRSLMVLAHLLMGAASAVLLPVVWPSAELPPLTSYAWPLAGMAGFYLLGQVGLFMALRTSDASRISPLLGLKIPFLAVVTVLYFHDPLGGWQWAAVAMAMAAAVVLSLSGGRISLEGLVGLGLACVSYSLSDLCIAETAGRLDAATGIGWLHASVLTLAMCYVLCGVAAVVALPLVWKPAAADWKYAAPFAFFWFGGMAFLFATFASIGVVYGNILQSTRGLMSVAVGTLLARMGQTHLETRHGRRVWIRRGLAAALMFGAITTYLLSGADR